MSLAPASPSTPDQQARAVAGPPVGRRRLWAVCIARCPHCQGMHLHRAGDGAALKSGRLTRNCAVTGAAYTISVVRMAGRRS